jgi:hypothetical protein
MANEITASTHLRIEKGNLIEENSITEQYDMTGTRVFCNVQAVGTTHEAIAMSADITDYGYAWIRNLDATNYVELGLLDSDTTFKPFSRLYAGQVALLPLTSSAVTYYAKANTGACDLQIKVGQR